jgi:hypothetical protein
MLVVLLLEVVQMVVGLLYLMMVLLDVGRLL